MNTGVANSFLVFCVIAAAASLGLAIFFGITDWKAAARVRDFAKNAVAPTSTAGTQNPLQPQAGGLPIEAIAKLAEALEKINPSGRFLVAAIAFTAAATLVISVGAAKG
ncbi:hypothetical protein [Mycobacterium palustre]|uniref:hypothetical protein n=1 Tax=Mycobacterium palustre TaxID=153971 RepID=UPI00114F7E3B|nr:hypothetical protein [Mycobacterium palustre]MCV7101149.1 hypothetical protein [Mycobacterium palustre]